MPEEENVTQTQIVRPIIKTKDALSDLRAFEELKTNLLSSSDFQAISGRNFIKKSGWRKLALVFNISDQIIESSKEIREDGSFIWTFRVRATAPNGRFTESVGSGDSRERKFAHAEHDVLSTASTRAKSRAISDLIGAGEVSAEEMNYDASPRLPNLDSELSEEDELKARAMLRPAIKMYQNEKPAIAKQRVTEKNQDPPQEDNARTFELALGGMPFHVDESEPPFSRFFLGKICKSISENNPGSKMELMKDEQGLIRSIIWYNLPKAQQKEIENTLVWSLKKIAEKKRIK